MRVAVTGSHGLIGSALTSHLAGGGHDVVRLVRSEPAPGDIEWDPRTGRLDPAELAGVDVVVNLAGAGIGDHRWTDDYKREIRDSRTRGTALVSEAIAAVAGEGRPPVLLSASAIDYYGDRGDEPVDESSPPGSTFLADVCRDWEAATAAAESAGARVVHFRTGIVLSRHRWRVAQAAPPVQARRGRTLRVGPAVDELDLTRRRAGRDRAPHDERCDRPGEPDRARAGHQRASS